MLNFFELSPFEHVFCVKYIYFSCCKVNIFFDYINYQCAFFCHLIIMGIPPPRGMPMIESVFCKLSKPAHALQLRHVRLGRSYS